jgi:hypothetical protein
MTAVDWLEKELGCYLPSSIKEVKETVIYNCKLRGNKMKCYFNIDNYKIFNDPNRLK